MSYREVLRDQFVQSGVSRWRKPGQGLTRSSADAIESWGTDPRVLPLKKAVRREP
jgi:hypothetical protein